jgi:hypothetical protein
MSMELLTTKQELEQVITNRNQNHAKQSLATPFGSYSRMREYIDINNPINKIDRFLNGTYINNNPDEFLTPTEKLWIEELAMKVNNEICINISVQDFINYFKRQMERTASSHSK